LIIARRPVILPLGTATLGLQNKSPEGPSDTLTFTTGNVGYRRSKDGAKIVPLVETIGTTEGST
jgi:hypothetical protein